MTVSTKTLTRHDRPDLDTIRRAPKVLLHDHLDGGLRPQTLLELADEAGYRGLPERDAAALSRYFHEAAFSGSLVRYLEVYDHTVAVLQSAESLRRVAREAVVDLANDGVVYAELRYAPELSLRDGLGLDEAQEAIVVGLAEGEREAAASGKTIIARSLVCAMRQASLSLEVAQLAVRFRDKGVVGFDIAGPEEGFPPGEHLAAFEYLRKANVPFTIHAGEAYGPPSIKEAVAVCGTSRIGHGVRIMEDIEIPDPEDLSTVKLGLTAHTLRDRRIGLELCPTSNVQTGAARSLAEHPIKTLLRLGFRATLNTDSRLLGDASPGEEAHRCVEALGLTIEDIRKLTVNAARCAFVHYPERKKLIEEIIVPGYDALADWGEGPTRVM
ncbi:MAG: adenosine deaminase [Segniliparus sp.]|uniref:adenosine deaminase n=1 Tax=Segniliparus sp. TaxID=2804064 RepID=UPI003F348D18